MVRHLTICFGEDFGRTLKLWPRKAIDKILVGGSVGAWKIKVNEHEFTFRSLNCSLQFLKNCRSALLNPRRDRNPKVLSTPSWAKRSPGSAEGFYQEQLGLAPLDFAHSCHLQKKATTAPLTLKEAELRRVEAEEEPGSTWGASAKAEF